MSSDPYEVAPMIRRKPALSTTPGARYARDYRQRVKRGIRMEKVPIGEKDLDAFARAGLLNERDREAASAAVRALIDLLEK